MTSPTLNGIGVQYCELTLPYHRRWHFDVKIMGGISDTSGAQTLNFVGTNYVGSIYRTATEAGSRTARIVGGTGGLDKVLPAKGYSSSSGVMLSVVVGDLASECGETINLATDRSLGQSYVRAQMTAGRTLNNLTGGTWWMDPTGTIQTGVRDTSAISTNFIVKRWRGAQGIYEVYPDVPTDWTPGRTFSNAITGGTVSRVEHRFSAEKLQTIVMVGDQGEDRLQDPFSSSIQQVQDGLLYYLTWPFTVNRVSAGPPVTMQLQSNDSRMPNLQRVVLWPDASGAWATPPVGAAVRVRFVAADPTQPEVYGLDPANAPTKVYLGGGGPGVARSGDSVTITQAEITAAGWVAGSTPITATADLTCKITSASTVVQSG